MKKIRRISKWMAICMLVVLVISACSPKEKKASSEETPPSGLRAEDRKFVLVSGSKFLMGSEKEAPLSREDEYPQHEVILTSFFIMQREVTNLEFRSCMDAGICTEPLVEEKGPSSLFYDPKYNNWPVVNVDWFQAAGFCEWMEARLPTEAEWEKASRGREGATFPWGEDDPTCEKANSADCLEEPNTAAVLSFPLGESPYLLTETSGNVREWTSDWYNPDFYTAEVAFEPTGPAEGELKVTRGGAWNDGEENLRAAARMPMDPHEQSDSVGFRCVAVGQSMAPICQNTYRNFCEDPRVPDKPGDEPCIPEEESGDCGGTAIASFGCPDGDFVTVDFSVPAGGEYDVNIGTSGFECEQGDGVIYCTGPTQKMGSDVTVTVCGPPPQESETEPVSAAMTISSALFSRILNPMLASMTAQAGMNHFGFCPEGYQMDPDTGNCVKEEQQPCPVGWTPDTRMVAEFEEEMLVCIPDGPESCPENSQFNKETATCDLVDLEIGCPIGFTTNLEKQVCSPPEKRLTSCLPGYWMDSELECCVPMENPCQENEYFETRIDECLEPQPGGCPDCTYLDEYEGCIPIPGCVPGSMGSIPEPQAGGDQGAEGEQTPGPILALMPAGMGALQPDCYPDDTETGGGCSPPAGDGEGECSEDYIYAPDPQTGQMTCVPAYGPGSGCPRGYIVDPRVNCCVPLDNPCPDPVPGSTGGVENPFFSANFFGANPFSNVVFGDGNFNPYGGDCENGDGGEEDGCPPGTALNNDGGCEDETGGGSAPAQCPYGCWPDYANPSVCQCEPTENFTCPEGDCWLADTKMNTCSWTCGGEEGGNFNPCDSDNQVWIPELELCVPRGDDCCPPGYDWNTVEQVCLPIFQQGYALMPNMGEIMPDETQSECSEGYQFLDGTCVLASRRGEERCCWTTSVNVPVCVGPCRVGFAYNPGTGACERPTQAAPDSGTTAPAPAPACTCSPTDCNMIGNPCYGRNPCC